MSYVHSGSDICLSLRTLYTEVVSRPLLICFNMQLVSVMKYSWLSNTSYNRQDQIKREYLPRVPRSPGAPASHDSNI